MNVINPQSPPRLFGIIKPAKSTRKAKALLFVCFVSALSTAVTLFRTLEQDLMKHNWHEVGRSSLKYDLPPSFVFEPSLDERPPKSRAVITTLFTANPFYRDGFRRDSDWFFTGAYFQAYTFLHNNITRIQPHDDAEFVVMVTDMVSKDFKTALLDLGTRVLTVPVIEIEGRKKNDGDKYQYLYTKLNMFRLEPVYDAILFLDVDLSFLHKPVMNIFNYITPARSYPYNSTTPSRTRRLLYFGSTPEWKRGYGAFNSGLQLLTPSEQRFQELFRLAQDPNYARYGDQGLLNQYFHPSGAQPVHLLPQILNTHHLTERNSTDIESAVGFHSKFWSECRLLSDASKPVWKMWQQHSVKLRGLQMRKLEKTRGYDNVTLMPAIPDTCEEWQSVAASRSGHFLKMAIVSFGGAVESIESHRRYASTYEQASHFHVSNKNNNSANVLWAQLRKAAELMDRYEWVWFPHAQATFKPAQRALHFELAEFRKGHAHIVTFGDCMNASLSAGFLVSRGGAKKLDGFLAEFPMLESSEDAEVWQRLVAEFTKNGGHASVKNMTRTLIYDVDCSGNKAGLLPVRG
ncbi:hypothetical protein CcCBS67573_g02772 [Chytriomyces confervae]|uniref:Nucleotide-diphospho-sugar transferase domain-containing protein n=1 Tax=Chytriomyces confervae TaxID=246404 RepID=A0A507FID0_9FUNG|nr:hypothetical protein HDU80_005206 [Chytriomyces hyalinus]TPX75972.1 hypothetical protein CcCBS67573_g02772 [Chytriomyces confervae]